MSELPQGVTYKDTPAKVKVIAKDKATPGAWYNKLVGQTLDVQKRTWYENGRVTSSHYFMPRTPDDGYNGSLHPDCIEVLES